MKTRTKKHIAAAIGWFLLFLMCGIVGGMDGNTIPLTRGFIEAMGCILIAGFYFHKAGMLMH